MKSENTSLSITRARRYSPTLAGWRRQTLPRGWKMKGDKQCPEEQMKWKLKSQLKEEKGRERKIRKAERIENAKS